MSPYYYVGDRVKESCRQDTERLCAHKHRDEERQCMMINFAGLSAECQSALTTLYSAIAANPEARLLLVPRHWPPRRAAPLSADGSTLPM